MWHGCPSTSNEEGTTVSSPTDIKPTLSSRLTNATTPTSKRYVQMINDASGPLDDILDSMITPKNNRTSWELLKESNDIDERNHTTTSTAK
jgi:hypothetical protein|tara:strand:+ start:539 stop:811 length:273 start_codon:yes stop_codon:yes gene_type:complete